MSRLNFCFFSEQDVDLVFEFVQQVNNYTDPKVLRERVVAMFGQNYKCLGIFRDQICIGICGMWFQTRHYSGYSLEVDHVVISEEVRSQGVGKELFAYLESWAKIEGFEAIELNTYVKNVRSHKFYEDLGFDFRGRHYVKEI